MGGTTYSADDHAYRSKSRADSGKATFDYDASIKSGKIRASVHASLSPFKAFRESRDSDAHPVTLPIAIIMDTTGSMGRVPVIIQRELSKLMGVLVDDKLSGKKYLGDAYPAVLIGAIDDYNAQASAGHGGEGALQIGQFESGIEIDDNLTNLWLTQNGGGTYEESYELALWFMANRTAHDAMDRRNKKGYLFLIGDEHAYDEVKGEQVAKLVGVPIQGNASLVEVIRQAQELYHVFFIIPNLSQHYNDSTLERYWVKLLGQQNVIKLDIPEKICECIAGAVALSEGYIGLDDLKADGVDSKALVRLRTEVTKPGSGALTKGGKTERL